MLKKEWNEIIVLSLISTGIACLFPGLLILIRVLPGLTYAEAFFPMFQFCMFFWAFFLGASFLSSDRRQRGVVYLLSLPYSRLRLFILKALPRFFVLLLLYGLFIMSIFLWGKDLTAISLISFSLIYFVLFVISLSVSASSDNFLVLFFVTLFGLVAFWGLQLLFIQPRFWIKGYTFYEFDIRTFFSGELDRFLVYLLPGIAVLLLVPVLIAFVWAFTKFDARPVSVFNKRYLARLAGIFVLGTAAALLYAYQTTDIGDTAYSLKRDAIYWHFPHYRGEVVPYSIIRKDAWKLIKRYEGKTFELFNLKEDIGEQHDLADKMPEKVRELDAQLSAWLEHTDAKLPIKGNKKY
jgi:hypothetical protein